MSSKNVVRSTMPHLRAVVTAALILAASTSAQTDPTANRVRVRVVDADGRPVPAVEVRYGIERDADRQVTRTGEDGGADWPWQPIRGRRWFAVARRGDDCAVSEFSTTTRPDVVHELRLEPDRSFAVTVLDHTGEPVPGVEVMVAGGSPVTFPLAPLARAVTGTDGTCRIRHVQHWSRKIAAGTGRRRFDVRVNGLGFTARASLYADALPAAPVVLRLPPAGAIRLRLADREGRPISRGVGLLVEEEGHDGTGVGVSTGPDGTVVVAPVALDRRYAARLLPMWAHTRAFAGPRANGDTVAHELRIDEMPVIAGRLVHDGAPLAEAEFQVTMPSTRGAPGFYGGTVTTDADGRFRWPCGVRRAEAAVSLRFEGYASDTGTRVVFAARCEPGSHDLGTLEPVSPGGDASEVIVSGRILGEFDDYGEVQLSLRAGGVLIPGMVEWPDDEPVLEVDYTTGAFAFRGKRPDGRSVLLSARVNGLHFDPIHRFVEVGSTVDLEFTKLPSATATLAVPAWAAESVRVYLRAEQTKSGNARWHEPARKSRDGDELTCTFDGLEAGTWRLSVYADCCNREPIATVPDLRIAGADVTALGHIELPELRRARIAVKLPADAAATATTEPRVGFAGDPRGARGLPRDAEGRFVLAFTEPVDLVVRATGCRDAVLRAVDGDRSVELVGGPPVRVECAFEGLPEDARLTLHLPLAGELVLPDDPKGPVEDGIWTGRVADPGRYRLFGMLGGRHLGKGIVFEPPEITVPPAGGTFAVRARLRE